MQQTVSRVCVGGVCRRSLSVLALLCSLAPLAGAQKPPPARTETLAASPTPAKTESKGTFTDRSGSAHNWQITASHALLWDGAPYLPVGGAVTPGPKSSP